ncbi:MAG: hypothetical protein DRO14_03050 [Thermoprotei archaeon]|nr:MAG: hypothetical protein DRO14_03050 [Thermoprotei archaeon]
MDQRNLNAIAYFIRKLLEAASAGILLVPTEKALRKLSEKSEVVCSYLGRTYALHEDFFILKGSCGEYLKPDTNLEERVKAHVGSRPLEALLSGYHKLVKKIIKRCGRLSKLMIPTEVPLPTSA